VFGYLKVDWRSVIHIGQRGCSVIVYKGDAGDKAARNGEMS
jgi:hypothetical protein